MSKINQSKIINAVNTICDVVKSTLGTNGRTVLFNTYDYEDRPDKPQTTKDGATAAKSIRSLDAVENMIIAIIREGTFKTALSSGDGTTTTTILIQSLVLKGIELMNEGVSYYELKKAFDACKDDIITYLKENTIRINDNMPLIKELVSISANDEKIGDEIYELYQEIGFNVDIDVKESFLSNTSIERVKGMRWQRGWYEEFMINNQNKNSFEADDCCVLIIDGSINTLESIIKYTEVLNNGPLVIFCNEISQICLADIKDLMTLRKLPICFIEHDGFGDRRRQMLNDLSAMTGAYVVKPDTPCNLENLGSIKNIVVKQFYSAITFDPEVLEANAEIIENQVKEIDIRLESDLLKNNTELSNNERKFQERRKANFLGGIAVISVGGKTQVEMRELKDRYDDAVLAVASALREGVSFGGGYTFLNCQKYLNKTKNQYKGNREAYEVVQKAIETPFKQLLINSDCFNLYNDFKSKIQKKKGLDLRSGKFYDLKNYSVYDSTAVLMDSINNSIAVAKTLLSIKEILADGIRSI